MSVNLTESECLIVENQYFTCINLVKYLFLKTHINIYPFEPYRKMSFRNRCVVAGSNGLVHLSIPVENGRNQKAPFRDVRISYREDWQTHHWRTLTSCYNKSAFFEFYRDGVEKFFLEREVFLFDLNIKILFWLNGALKMDCKIDIVENPPQAEETAFIDLRDRWLPKNFQADDRQNDGKILLPALKYFQVFENRIGFQPNLSILDLLFNEGPNAAALLKDSLPAGGLV